MMSPGVVSQFLITLVTLLNNKFLVQGDRNRLLLASNLNKSFFLFKNISKKISEVPLVISRHSYQLVGIFDLKKSLDFSAF